MQSLGLEIVIAAMLFFLLWSMGRDRNDLRLRYWMIGWGMVTVRMVTLLVHPRTLIMFRLRDAHFAVLEVLAGVCFILSDRSITRLRSLQWRVGLLCAAPAVAVAALVLFVPNSAVFLFAVVIAAHTLAIVFSRIYAGLPKSKFFSLSAVHFLSGSFMLGSLALGHPRLVLASVPAEIFAVNAILFSRNYPIRYPGNILTIAGFVMWMCSSFTAIAISPPGFADAVFPHSLDLPQFLVAIGMIMILLEEKSETARELLHEYELLYENNPFPLWIYDLRTTRILSANAAAAELHGYTIEEMCSKKLTEVIHPEMLEVVRMDLASPAATPRRHSLHVRKDGSVFPMNVTAYDIELRGRKARIALAEDTSEREELASQLLYQVSHDALTGLANRSAFLQELDHIHARARQHNTGCAVLAVHVNRFEKINENYGHAAGDEFLQILTERLQSRLRTSDAIGRTGSREFTVALACSTDAGAVEARARELLRAIGEPALISEHTIVPSLTMGMAMYPQDSDTANGLLRDAARAQAMTQLLNAEPFIRLTRQLGEVAEEQNRIEALLQHVLTHGGFELHYQRILDTNGETAALEALLRLQDANGKFVSPAVFIPIAEATGAILKIGRWVIGEVARQLAAWRAAGYELVPVALNISALEIVQPNFATEVLDTLLRHNVPPQYVQVELTESSAMPENLLALENMLALTAAGVQISIDDFGTGFSSLYRLHKVPAALLKIDRSFVAGMMELTGTYPIVLTIISMAHSLNMGVIAEGVETEDQFNTLMEMGCDQFQGYYFCRPLPAAQVEHSLRRKSVLELRAASPAPHDDSTREEEVLPPFDILPSAATS